MGDPLEQGTSTFISVRSQGLTLSTKSLAIKKNNVFVFAQSLFFPVKIPTYNDKISIRLWQNIAGKLYGGTVSFQSNIPEKPSVGNFANISYLIPLEGKMNPMWVNLYGIKFSERNDSRPQGNSQYMGRVLMSFHMIENERPMFQVTSNPATYEPVVGKYKLYLDTYEMVNCDDLLNHQICIQATVGSHETPKKRDAKLDPQSQKFFKWKNIKTEKKEPIEDLPQDPEQCPDIIIYVFAKSNSTFGGAERRVGFVRLTAKSVIRNDPRPTWYVVLSIENSIKEIGLLLMNVQLKRDHNGLFPEHVPAKRGKQIPYLFFAQILSGFEIAPHFPESSLLTQVKVQIGSDIQNEIKTDFKAGRFPFYNKTPVASIVTLDSNVSFSSDMKVTLVNQQYSIFGNYENKIGSFMVPVASIIQFYTYPQYYNVIDDSGNMIGKVLARFYLYKKPMAKSDDFEKKIREHMVTNLLKQSDKFDITFSVLGLRNLCRAQKQSKIRVSLTQHLFSLNNKQETTKAPEDQPQFVDLVDKDCIIIAAESDSYTKNINFGKTIRFKDVEMSVEPLLWPWLIIDEVDRRESQVLSRALVPLFVYAEQVYESKKQKFTIALFKNIDVDRDDNYFDQDQMQISPARHYYKAMIEKIERQSVQFYQDVGLDGDLVLFKKETVEEEVEQHLQIGPMKLKFDHGAGQREEKEGVKLTGSKTIGAYLETDDEAAHDDVTLIPKKQIAPEEETDVEDEQNDSRSYKDDPYEIVHFRKEYAFDLECTAKDKENEKRFKELQSRQKQALIEHLEKIQEEAKIKKYLSVIDSARVELQKLRKLKEDLDEEQVMDVGRFNYNPVEISNQFDYKDREVLKNSSADSMLSKPFKDFQLLTDQKGFFTSEFAFEFVDGIYRSGKVQGSFIRANLKVQRSEDREALDEEGEQETPLVENVIATSKGENEIFSDLKLSQEQEIFEKYKFDPMKAEILEFLLKPHVQYKVRVYLLSCQNLSATDSAVGFSGKLAGIQAMSSADPYPVITIGSGVNGDGGNKFIRTWSDLDKPKEKTLNPQFYRYYEMDCILPQDLKMVVAIWDKGGIFGDTLIGQTEIDLELRRFGDKFIQARELVNVKLREIQAKIKLNNEKLQKFKGKDRKNCQDEIKFLRVEESQLETWQKNYRDKKKLPQQPVEFRELKNQNNLQTQGIVQMWCEIVTLDEHRLNPPEELKEPNTVENYEVRLIIWETREIPLGDAGKVSLYVKATMIQDDFADANVSKQTDTHNNIEDGKGVYNYRMCFDVQMPAEFPRILLQTYDQGFISEECQSETIINIKNAINLYRTQGRIEMKPVWASFNVPGRLEETAGYVLISLQVMTKEEAQEEPAGDGQSEPNQNPRLEKPTVGRGYGEVLAAMGVTLPTITLPSFDMFKKIMIVVIVIVVLAVVGFLMWYLKPAG